MRTSGEKETYQWWYFDAHLENGSTAVIACHTKAMTNIDKPSQPYVTLSINKTDGTKRVYKKDLLTNNDTSPKAV
ncbi:hypothetical protein [Psychroserpens sp. NJDZ02]|uniref:hypothetical protein n=1 Tax=Psychroserpens sp. NJDZ02 TaxID=2570561 RepID=UPI0010A928E3|nr:hypothetical protein [Psychroserpens sp. NJDZ02]QCE40032.1 hypothetical protein E9099_00875 [Psychroserpens sp. NJDZ02]